MRPIHLIRHGATEFNNDDPIKDRIRGWKDVPLSPLGRSEAHRIAEEVSGDPPQLLFCSDLVRARETARIIAGRNRIVAVPGMDFRPWDTGDFAGKSAADVVPTLLRYAAQRPSTAVPGGESFDSFRLRFFGGLLKAFVYNIRIGIVTHHRNERLLKAWAKAGFPVDGQPDETEFGEKGKPTGHWEVCQIPIERLVAAVELRSGVWRRSRGAVASVGRDALVQEHLSRR